MAQNTLFEFFGRLFFSRTRVRRLEREMAAAGVDVAPDAFAGYLAMNVIWISVLMTLLLMVYAPAASLIISGVNSLLEFDIPAVVIGIALFFIILGAVYLAAITLLSTYLIMRTENRRNALEASLPDFLTLVASNIKAGMTLDQSMWYSAKPEFGLLSDEVKSIVKSSFSGESLESALDKLAMRFDSRVFVRTISLLKQATASGGELTEVLERTAEDVRNTSIMRKEISASMVIYEILVLFAAVVGTPFLFGVAQKLIEIFEKVPATSPVGIDIIGGFKVGGGGAIVSSAEFFYFAMPTIFVTALFSSFIVSAIRSGTRSQGLKYFPFVLIGAFIVYWVVSTVLTAVFSNIV